MTGTPTADPGPGMGVCCYGYHTMPLADLEPFNHQGNLACKNIARCARKQAAEFETRMQAMLAEVRAACTHPAGPPFCDCRWTLAERIGTRLGYDDDSAALLALSLWEETPASPDPEETATP